MISGRIDGLIRDAGSWGRSALSPYLRFFRNAAKDCSIDSYRNADGLSMQGTCHEIIVVSCHLKTVSIEIDEVN